MVIMMICRRFVSAIIGPTMVFLIVFLQWNNVNVKAEMITDSESSQDYFKKLGDPCTLDDHCEAIRDGTCDETSRTCVCKETHPIEDTGTCFEPAMLNHTCNINRQCEYTMKYAVCGYSKPRGRVCQCPNDHPQILNETSRTPYCLSDRRPTDVEIDYTMMGVLAGMIIMFIIMCIVLRMFSKARFQDQRTIFNDPQMMRGSLARKIRERTESDRRGSKGSSRAPSRQPSVHSGLNLPIKSPTNSQGSARSGRDSRRSSFGSPRNTDDVIVNIKGGQNSSYSPVTNRV